MLVTDGKSSFGKAFIKKIIMILIKKIINDIIIYLNLSYSEF